MIPTSYLNMSLLIPHREERRPHATLPGRPRPFTMACMMAATPNCVDGSVCSVTQNRQVCVTWSRRTNGRETWTSEDVRGRNATGVDRLVVTLEPRGTARRKRGRMGKKGRMADRIAKFSRWQIRGLCGRKPRRVGSKLPSRFLYLRGHPRRWLPPDR